MPVYAYKCGASHNFDVVKKVAELDREERCPKCGDRASRQIVLPMIAADYPGYESPATGKWIEGKRAHIEDLKRSGCRILEPGESEHYMKHGAAERRAKNEKLIDQAIESAARDLGMGS